MSTSVQFHIRLAEMFSFSPDFFRARTVSIKSPSPDPPLFPFLVDAQFPLVFLTLHSGGILGPTFFHRGEGRCPVLFQFPPGFHPHHVLVCVFFLHLFICMLFFFGAAVFFFL